MTDLEGKPDDEFIDDEEEEEDGDLDWLANLEDEDPQEEGAGDGEIDMETINFDTQSAGSLHQEIAEFVPSQMELPITAFQRLTKLLLSYHAALKYANYSIGGWKFTNEHKVQLYLYAALSYRQLELPVFEIIERERVRRLRGGQSGTN
jgi:hypothetical protein